jgi:hypothetical protein
LGGAPEWFEMSSPADSFWRPELNDPRWAGAPLFGLVHTLGSTSTETAQARVLTYGDYMYFMVQVLLDDEGPGANDSVLLGITAGSASQAYAMRIKAVGDNSGGTAPPASSSGDPAPQDSPLPEGPGSTAVVHWDSDASGSFASSASQAGALSFVDQIAIWKPAASAPAAGPNRKWAVTFRLNKSASGLNPSAGSIRLFLGTSVRMDLSGSPATASFANATPVSSGGVGSTIVPASSSSWGRFAEVGTACNAGISVSSMDIGVFEGTPPGSSPTTAVTQRICAKDPCPMSIPNGNPRNIFRATARNVDTSAGLADWEVRARFRYADWGSTVANRKYGPWKDIAATPVGTAILTGPDTPLTNANGWYWQDEDDGATAQTAVIDFQCALVGSGTYCPTLSSATNLHQCLLVELGVPPGINRELATTAVYQNMNFVPLSTVDREATISIEGLKEMTGVGQDRDVYLYVQTENMPGHQREPLWLPTEQMAEAAKLAQQPIPIPIPPPKAQPGAGRRTHAVQPKVDPKTAEAKRKIIADRAGRFAASNQKIGDVRVSSTLAVTDPTVGRGVAHVSHSPVLRHRAQARGGRSDFQRAGAVGSIWLLPLAPRPVLRLQPRASGSGSGPRGHQAQ